MTPPCSQRPSEPAAHPGSPLGVKDTAQPPAPHTAQGLGSLRRRESAISAQERPESMLRGSLVSVTHHRAWTWGSHSLFLHTLEEDSQKSPKPQPGSKPSQALEGATPRLNKDKKSFQHQLMTTMPPAPTPDYSSEPCHYSQMIPR